MTENPMADKIEVRVAELLIARSLKLGIAESCTGGLMGHRLTNVPGSSKFFRGGVVAYSYEAKETVLHVAHETLLTYGAVSKEVAVQMAVGAKEVFRCDYALSITGIAGPGGGMPGKPVGLTYIGLASDDGIIWRKYIWQGTRTQNKQQSVEAALRFLEEAVLKKEKEGG